MPEPPVSASIVEGIMTPSAEAAAPDHAPAQESLHRALGLTDDEFEAVGKILGRPPNHLELALYCRHVERALLPYKSSPPHLRRLPTEGPCVLCRAGRECRGHRRRGRHRRRHPDREPQSPVRRRAVPGRGDRGGRDPAGHLHHGRPPARRDGSALRRFARTMRASAGWSKAWCRGSRATAIPWASPPSGASSQGLRRLLLAQNPLVNVWLCMGALADRAPRAGHRVGPGQPRRAPRLEHRRRGRHRRSERARLGRLQRRRGGRSRRYEAAERPGGRSVRGEAAHRGVPRAARPRPRGRHPGPRRCGARVRDERDGRTRRRRHGRRRLGRPAA